jgi:hypothetical protein
VERYARQRQFPRRGAVFTVRPGTIITHGLGRLYPCLPHCPHVSLFHLPSSREKQSRTESPNRTERDRERNTFFMQLLEKWWKPAFSKRILVDPSACYPIIETNVQ